MQMSDFRTLCRLWLLGGMAVWLLTAPGCAPLASSLEFTSHKDPYAPRAYTLTLDQCAYYVGPGGDYHIVGGTTHSDADGAEIRQYVHVHLFWKPWPGKTFDNPSSVDATVRYAIVTGQGAAMYSGTGFVYLKKKRLSDAIVAKIEDARLRLDSQSGSPPDVLGPTRLNGTLVAEKKENLAIDLRRQLEVLAATGAPLE